MRGCSLIRTFSRSTKTVFPAGAGVFLSVSVQIEIGLRVPRRCGGVPIHDDPELLKGRCSPQVRGCSQDHLSGTPIQPVFPAGAGVFLTLHWCCGRSNCVPRRCGGVPIRPGRDRAKPKCSPQVRGCSRGMRQVNPYIQVFPAGAGVFPQNRPDPLTKSCVPRRCGGVPDPQVAVKDVETCSPQVRGCSYEQKAAYVKGSVFPAGAGVFLA